MRKLVLHMIMSIDGFIADHDGAVNPQTQWDEEMQRFYIDMFTQAEAAIFGRRLYEQYVLHWDRVATGELPPETEPELQWTKRLRAMPKYVISNTSPHLAANTRVTGGDIKRKLTELKQEPGGDMLLMCGPSLLAQLSADQLIDEHMLYVCPSALGNGVHLFRDMADHLELRYERTVPFHTGVNLHYYQPVYQSDGA